MQHRCIHPIHITLFLLLYSTSSYFVPNHSSRMLSTFSSISGVILSFTFLYTYRMAAPSSRTPSNLYTELGIRLIGEIWYFGCKVTSFQSFPQLFYYKNVKSRRNKGIKMTSTEKGQMMIIILMYQTWDINKHLYNTTNIANKE